MALFPAYGGGDGNKNETLSEVSDEKQDWLSLQSYKSGTSSELTFEPEIAKCETIEARLHDKCENQKPEVFAESRGHDSSSYSEDEVSRKRCRKEAKEKKSHKKHKKKKKKHHKHLSEESYELKVSSPSLISQLPASDKVFVKDILSLIKTPYAFSIDKRPDRDNVSFGCIYRTKIARYRLFGNSKVNAKNKPKVGDGRYFRSRADVHEKVIPNTSSSLLSDEFIPLMSEKSKDDVGSLGSHMEVLDDKSATVRKKVEEYNRLLNADPHNETLWLEFVDFQKSALCLKQEDNRSKDDVECWLKADGRTLVEIKCAILEKAVEKNPSSKMLRLAQLELMGSECDVEKLSQEWKKLVFSFANDAEVWRRYLGFVKGCFSTFTVSRVVGVYAKCLSTLDSIRSGTMMSHKELPNTIESMIDIFGDLCIFLCQSGRTEQAISICQAQMEYNFFCPSLLLDVAVTDRIDFLSAFWDSGVPRIGEVGSKGWEDWVINKGVYSPSSLSANAWSSREGDEREEEELIKTRDEQSELWLAFENSRSSRHWLPWKQLLGNLEDDDECEDSERIVLFEDISKCLFFVTSVEHKFALFSKFSDFLDRLCGLKTIVRNFSDLSTAEFASEIFRYDDAKVLFSHLSSGLNLENYSLFRSNIFTQMTGKFDNIYRTCIYLREIDFQLNRIPCYSDSERPVQRKDLKKFLKQLLSIERNNTAIWQRYAVSEFQAGNFKEARKVFDTAITASRIDSVPDISSYESCVSSLLYRTYASLELGLKIDTLCSSDFYVLKKLPGTSPTQGGSTSTRAICILVALCEGSNSLLFNSVIPPTKLLKCQHLYSQTLDTLFEQFTAVTERKIYELVLQLHSVGNTLVHWFACGSAFQYLVNGIEAMTKFAEEFLTRMSSSYGRRDEIPASVYDFKKSVNQSCVETYSGLLSYHVSNCVSPLRSLRVHLISSLKQFHESRFLLESFVNLESTFSIAGRLRKYFHENIGSGATPSIPLFAVLSEFKRMHNLQWHQTDQPLGGIVMETGVSNQLRAWFELSVNQQTNRSCILIWRLYMFFEAQMKNSNNVKAVFYKALQQCPWAKIVYLDCVRYVPEMLQEVNDLMTEKGLRVRTPLEELALLMSGKNALSTHDEVDNSNEQREDLLYTESRVE